MRQYSRNRNKQKARILDTINPSHNDNADKKIKELENKILDLQLAGVIALTNKKEENERLALKLLDATTWTQVVADTKIKEQAKQIEALESEMREIRATLLEIRAILLKEKK